MTHDVCVYMRERERERERERVCRHANLITIPFHILQIQICTRVENCLCPCVCVCVCFKEREGLCLKEYVDMLTLLTIQFYVLQIQICTRVEKSNATHRNTSTLT